MQGQKENPCYVPLFKGVVLTSHPCYLCYIFRWSTSRWPLVIYAGDKLSYAGPTRFLYPLSDVYSRGPARCPYHISDEYIRRVPHTTRYPEDMTKCRGSKRKKGMVHNVGAWQVFKKYGHPDILKKRGTTHNPAVKWSLKILGT